MMKKIISVIIFISIITESTFGKSNENENEIKKTDDIAPKGYSWHKLDKAGISILKPDGWHVYKPFFAKDSYVFKLSRETPEQGFHTGLTLNIFLDVKKKSKVSPSRYAIYFIKKQAKVNSVIETFPLTKLEKGIQRCGITVEEELTIKETTELYTIHYTLFANDTTGTLYLLIFGTPSKKWTKDQDIWSTMRKVKLNLNL